MFVDSQYYDDFDYLSYPDLFQNQYIQETNNQPHVNSLHTPPTSYDDSESSGENGISKVENSQFSSAPAFPNDSMNGNPNSLLLDKNLPTINYPSSTMNYFSQASFQIQQSTPTQLTDTRPTYPSSQQISILANHSLSSNTITPNLGSSQFTTSSSPDLPETPFTWTLIDPNLTDTKIGEDLIVLTQTTNKLISDICKLIEEIDIDEAELRERKWDILSLQKNYNSLELKGIHKKLKNRKDAARSRATKKTTLIDVQDSIQSEHVEIQELVLKISELIGSCKIFISMYGQRAEELPIRQQIDTISAELNATIKLPTFPKLPEQQVGKANKNMTRKEKNRLAAKNFRTREIQIKELHDSYLTELKSKKTELIYKQQQIQNIFNSFKEYFKI